MFSNIFTKKNRVLLLELVKTDFKLRYQGSFLGVIWSVLRPLALFVVMYMVFVHFLRFGQGIPHFAVSLLLAIVLWNFFSETTSQGMQSLVSRASILRKINIPKYIVVVSASVSALINLTISLLIVVIFAIINKVEFSWTFIYLVPLIVELYVLALAIAVLLGVLFVKYRDLTHIWDVFLQAMFYFTPIIYPPSLVAAMSVTASKILMLNPIAQIVQDARHSLITKETETIWGVLQGSFLTMVPFIIIIIVIAVAIVVYKSSSKRLTEAL